MITGYFFKCFPTCDVKVNNLACCQFGNTAIRKIKSLKYDGKTEEAIQYSSIE